MKHPFLDHGANTVFTQTLNEGKSSLKTYLTFYYICPMIQETKGWQLICTAQRQVQNCYLTQPVSEDTAHELLFGKVVTIGSHPDPAGSARNTASHLCCAVCKNMA